ncbi:DUF481 domain-containing protein [Sulfurimonas sp.]|uniref:DUF481 domain-containing protein n=1 Tax=Sulfurimonas sp. TaxID=2022749 RepID=UPI003D0A741E
MKKIVLSLVALSSLMFAEDAPTEKPLKTHGELGYIQTNGNTETKALNLDIDLTKEWTKSIVTLSADGQYASDQGEKTKNKYTIEFNYGYKFSERLSFDYLIGYKDDEFSGFEYQFYTGPGMKYKAIDMEKHQLSTEANILYSVDRYEAIPPLEAYTDDYAGYRLKGVYDWQILESLKFKQELSLRGSFEDGDKYFIYSETALHNKINDIFSAGISYKVDYVNVPAAGKEKTDTTFAVNLILDY